MEFIDEITTLCLRCGKQLNDKRLCSECDYPIMRGKWGMIPMPNRKFERLKSN